ncbi:hypothetical protein [Paracoccus aminophilus]|uniref:PepSY domain-containing protein n=1 Tax=Paracoccus aminophilus JCM 7686 TaxID=1367847 RepID=S5Y5D1_PARAH|nr:hypothetical protein [Paracoccus aminophilus]AGT10925.1 hypothetical protein JCM7686_pAMI4p235 [Paracoccus aminophilus JCM 7686]
MLKDKYSIIRTGVKVGAISLLLAGAAVAQTTTTTVTTVPADSLPASTERLSDTQVTDFLTSKGLTDIKVTRGDGKINATGRKDGRAIALVYDLESGKLLTVDGKTGEQGAYTDFRNLGTPKSN